MGCATLHFWPDSLDSLLCHLTDCTFIDARVFPNDTAYRNTHWAAFATGLGAVWHELGHCFGLEHTTSGIMHRADDLHLCLGFPPLDSFCRKCSNLKVNNSSDENRLLMMDELDPSCQHEWLKPPSPLPSVLQFSSIVCISEKLTASTVSDRFWATCYSLWHQGETYWGASIAKQLSTNP
ncbi:unnamed protein product [Protopolystoma xenopodis]|uniref:Uncharacterized protein n=1 Tax=Protopolystoma xenopodis TaxID=117903 RepID=A0A3S5CQ78_9PLAT|nr:unnamed protein product [Protopolystoma xenopodis]